MEIPTTTEFLFVCKVHGQPLRMPPKPGGAQMQMPEMKHPNPEAKAVWRFDFSNMRCDGGSNSIGTECRDSWMILA